MTAGSELQNTDLRKEYIDTAEIGRASCRERV